MSWSKVVAVVVISCSSVLVASPPARAGDITLVVSGGPLPDVMGTLVPMFEKATGHKVTMSTKGGAAIAEDLKTGAADLVITGSEAVDEFVANGAVVKDGNTLVMISKIGLAVKAGAPRPDVSTPDTLKAALLAAKTVGYSRFASGQYFLTVVERLGIADEVKAKAVIPQSGPVGALIASGEAEIGVQQVAELRPVAGVDVIGELPPELQTRIPLSAGISAKAKDAATARALVAFLRSGAAQEVLQRKGMDLP
jgi:molybdate transport system substrate-binding protein